MEQEIVLGSDLLPRSVVTAQEFRRLIMSKNPAYPTKEPLEMIRYEVTDECRLTKRFMNTVKSNWLWFEHCTFRCGLELVLDHTDLSLEDCRAPSVSLPKGFRYFGSKESLFGSISLGRGAQRGSLHVEHSTFREWEVAGELVVEDDEFHLSCQRLTWDVTEAVSTFNESRRADLTGLDVRGSIATPSPQWAKYFALRYPGIPIDYTGPLENL